MSEPAASPFSFGPRKNSSGVRFSPSAVSSKKSKLAPSSSLVIKREENDEEDDDIQLSSPEPPKTFTQIKKQPSFLSHQFSHIRQLSFQSFSNVVRQPSLKNIGHELNVTASRIQAFLLQEPFIRTFEKITFTVGILFLLITEFVLIARPQIMDEWYFFWIIPILIYRYFSLKKANNQYFMLDWCYFCQILLMFYILFYPRNKELFQLVFSISNGPLAFAMVAWSSKLVFHDLEKTVSVLVHFFPPLVTYCLRWFPSDDQHLIACPPFARKCSISFTQTLINPLYFYIFWQVSYLIKTEMIDKEIIEKGNLMTSSQFLITEQPHPLYKALMTQFKSPWLRSHPSYLLIAIQLVYTIIFLIPAKLMYDDFYLHSLFLFSVFVFTLWNGAASYFDVCSDSYRKRKDSQSASSTSNFDSDEEHQIFN